LSHGNGIINSVRILNCQYPSLMKVVIFIGGLSGGGAERVACNLCNSLISYGHEVEFLTMSDQKAAYLIDSRAGRHCLLNEKEKKGGIYNNSLRYIRFTKYLISNKADLYIVMLPITIIMMLAFSFLTSSKIIASERADPSKYSTFIQKGLRLLCRRADGWVFQTPEVFNWYKKRLGNVKNIVIPNAINPVFFDNNKAKGKEKVIITSGRLNAQKRHDLLIAAFSKIANKHGNYQLMILGEGSLRSRLANQITELNIENRVLMPGYVDDIKERLSEASMFVLTSDFEGMPNALIEAMALGLPCVSTDCDGGGARFLIKDGENGLLVPKNDVAALANAMDRILSDDALAQKLGRNAEKVKEELHPDKIYGQWMDFIDKVVSS